MIKPILRRTERAILAIAIVSIIVSALVGCEAGGPAATQDAPPREVATQTPAEATAAITKAAAESNEPEPTSAADESAAPTATTLAPGPTPAGVAEPNINITFDTTWEDIFGVFTNEKQTCIRNQFGDDFESILAQRLFDDERETLIFECLGPDISRAIYLSHGVKYLENLNEVGELNEAEISCLRKRATGLDVAALSADDAADDAELMAGAISCVPDFLILVMATALGLHLEDFTRQETSCLRNFVAGLDEEALADLDDSATPEVISGIVSCIPDIFISDFIDRFSLTMEDLSRQEQSCLRETIADVGWTDDLNDAELKFCMLSCIPDVVISPFIDRFGMIMGDLSRQEQSCLRETIADVDWTDDLNDAELNSSMLSCIPDVVISDSIGRVGLTMEGLSRQEQSCLRDWVTDIDWSDDPDYAELAFGMLSCIPDVLISEFISRIGLTMENLSREEQSCLRERIADVDWSDDLNEAELNSSMFSCIQSSGGTQ